MIAASSAVNSSSGFKFPNSSNSVRTSAKASRAISFRMRLSSRTRARGTGRPALPRRRPLVSQVSSLGLQQLPRAREQDGVPSGCRDVEGLTLSLQPPVFALRLDRIPTVLPSSPAAPCEAFVRPRSGAQAAVEPTAAVPHRRPTARHAGSLAARPAPRCHREIARRVAVSQPAAPRCIAPVHGFMPATRFLISRHLSHIHRIRSHLTLVAAWGSSAKTPKKLNMLTSKTRWHTQRGRAPSGSNLHSTRCGGSTG